MHDPGNSSPSGAHRRRELALLAFAASHERAVGRGDLARLGFSRDEVRHRIRLGRLVEVFAGAYAVGPAPLSLLGTWRAAVVSSGGTARLSHRSGGELRRLLPEPATPGHVHVTVDRDGPRHRRGITVHGAGHGDRSAFRGIPCTSATRTLVDLAGCVAALELEDAVARAHRFGLLDVAAVLAILDDGGRHRGARTLRRVLVEHDPRSAPTRSAFERLMKRLCRRYDVRPPLVNARLDLGLGRPVTVDFLWPDERVVVETDGFAWHSDPSRLLDDRRRDVALKLARFERLRFGWADLTRREAVSMGQLRTLLHRGA